MPTPMYRQIAEDLREQIESGGLRPGQQMRTEIELRDHYGASRNTVRDAIKLLTTLGLVETKPGQGTFVVQKIVPYVTVLNTDPRRSPGGDITNVVSGASPGSTDPAERKVDSTTPRVEIHQASEKIANQLNIVEGAQVVSRHQARTVKGTPWSLQTSFYPMEFVLKGATKLIEAGDIQPGTVKYLAETLNLRQVGYRDHITVRAPDTTETSFFSLPPDGRVGVFEIFRTAYDETGQPMRLTVSVFPTDRNQFVVNVGDLPETQPGPALTRLFLSPLCPPTSHHPREDFPTWHRWSSRRARTTHWPQPTPLPDAPALPRCGHLCHGRSAMPRHGSRLPSPRRRSRFHSRPLACRPAPATRAAFRPGGLPR